MDRIWSPWRSALLRNHPDDRADAQDGPSIFSQLAAEDRDEENLILWRGAHVFVVMNAYPYNNGHLLIVPYREVQSYEDLDRDERIEVGDTMERCIRWIRAALRPEGFNVGMNMGKAGGAGIPGHLHVHIVPRWSGDTNFMPTLADVKVIPESIQDTYAALKAAILSQDGG